MLPSELNISGFFDILFLSTVGTWIFIILSFFTAVAYLWTGGEWTSKIEAVIFRQVNKLDAAFDWIFNKIFGKKKGGRMK